MAKTTLNGLENQVFFLILSYMYRCITGNFTVFDFVTSILYFSLFFILKY